MKKTFTLFVVMCCVLSAFALEDLKVGTTTRTMIVYAPTNLPKNAPLIIACHGSNQDAPYLQSLAKFESVADTAKFVVVYANGVGKQWDLYGDSDLKFMEAIIDAMYTRYGISKNRVYLTGFSMGGMFTYYCANKMADKFAAFAPVSGYNMGGPNANSTRPVPIIHTHGTGDDVCVYSPVQSHIDAWVRFNQCKTTPEITKPLSATNASTTSTLKRYRGGKNGVEVALLTLPGKGHWWSMDPPYGLTSVEVWNFCKRFSLGADAPEVKSIEPENNSFDLEATKDNTFKVTFSDYVNSLKAGATLASETTSIQLEVKSTGYKKAVTFALPADADVPDGTYTLTLSGIVNKDGAEMEKESFTYVYGVEEVGEKSKSEVLYKPDWYSEQEAIGEGIPTGWRRINVKDGKKEVSAGGAKDITGVRMKYFERGGDFDCGFYLSARDNQSCDLYYGTYTTARLPLKVGNYRVRFRSVYWSEGSLSAKATYDFNVTTTAFAPVFTASSLTSTGTMKENTEQQITGSTAYEFDFSITREANYLLDFQMTGGWNSVIVGDLELVTLPSLADLYKGTFYRTMLEAKKTVKGYKGKDCAKGLEAAIRKYADLVSTSPSVYTAATEEVKAAIAAFVPVGDPDPDEGDDETGIRTISNNASATTYYTLSGIPARQPQRGINLIRAADGKVKKVWVR